jgi:AraC family L-rhamnose operon transcriptional activator RhaR/AraC family L-rhamnose operon regulatory protein RhaS
MRKIGQIRRSTYFLDPRAQVAIRREPVQRDMRAHRHEFIEIVLVLSGSGVHVTEGARQEVRGGDVLVINSSRSHAYENTRSLNLVNILIREGIFAETEKELGALPGYHALFTLEPVRWRQRKFTSHLRLTTEELQQAVGWVDALEEETQRKSDGGLLLARSWIILLIGMLARNYGKNSDHAPRLDLRLGRILSRLEQDTGENFSTAELARQAKMSERTFLRRFREATGFSPIHYVLRARIRRATEMLTSSLDDLSITDIAFRCGFQDSNYFSRQFRRLVGMSPRNYRSQG